MSLNNKFKIALLSGVSSIGGSPQMAVSFYNAVSWQKSDDSSDKKTYYVNKVYSSENSEEPDSVQVAYAYIPINRKGSNIDGHGGRLYIDRLSSYYANAPVGLNVLTPGQYTGPTAIAETERTTFPNAFFGDTIIIRPSVEHGYDGTLYYYDVDGDPQELIHYYDGQRATGESDGIEVLCDRNYMSEIEEVHTNQDDIGTKKVNIFMLKVSPRMYTLNIDIDYGAGTFYYRFFNPDGSIYLLPDEPEPWDGWYYTVVNYRQQGHGTDIWYKQSPTADSIPNLPIGTKVQIYGTTWTSSYVLNYPLYGKTRDNPYEFYIEYNSDEPDQNYFDIAVAPARTTLDIYLHTGVTKVYYRKQGNTNWNSTTYSKELDVNVGDIYEYYFEYDTANDYTFAAQDYSKHSASSPQTITVNLNPNLNYISGRAARETSNVQISGTLTSSGNLLSERVNIANGPLHGAITVVTVYGTVVLEPSEFAGVVVHEGNVYPALGSAQGFFPITEHSLYIYYTYYGDTQQYVSIGLETVGGGGYGPTPN